MRQGGETYWGHVMVPLFLVNMTKYEFFGMTV